MEALATIELPADLIARADDTAASLGLSREQLIAQALEPWLLYASDQAITDKLNEVYADEDSSLDPALQRAQFAALPVERW